MIYCNYRTCSGRLQNKAPGYQYQRIHVRYYSSVAKILITVTVFCWYGATTHGASRLAIEQKYYKCKNRPKFMAAKKYILGL